MSQRKAFGIMSGLFLAGAAFYVACGDSDTDATPLSSDDGGADSTTGSDSGSGNDTGSTTDTGTTTDSGNEDAATDAGGDAQLVGDGGTITDAGPGGDGSVVNCGVTQCDLPAQTCCIYPVQGTSLFYSACSSGATCPSLDGGVDSGSKATELKCESQANCPNGQVCCMSSPSSGATSSHCVAEGSCNSTAGNKSAILCDPSAADAGCGDAGACSGSNIGSWNLPAGFSTCGGVSK